MGATDKNNDKTEHFHAVMEQANHGTNWWFFFLISEKHGKFLCPHFSELKNEIKNFIFLKVFMCEEDLGKVSSWGCFFLGSRTKHQPQGIKSRVFAAGGSVLGPDRAQIILSWCVRNTKDSGEILGRATVAPGCQPWLSLSLVLTWKKSRNISSGLKTHICTG